MLAVGRGQIALLGRSRGERVEFARAGVLGVGAALKQQAQRLGLLAHRLLRRGNRFLAADRQRQHQPGEQHHAAHRAR